MSKTVKVIYNAETLMTEITVNGQPFDTSRINGKEIADWAYPFMMRKVKWNGFYDEMVEALGGEKAFDLVFDGSEDALNELKESWEDASVTVISEEGSGNNVIIEYDENTLNTNITVNGQTFDASRINGKEIEDWVYPFMVRKVKWNGIFEELAKVTGSDEYTIQFSGSDSALRVLMEECPSNVSVVRRSSSVISKNDTNPSVSLKIEKPDFDLMSAKELLDYIENSCWRDLLVKSEVKHIADILRKYANQGNHDAQYELADWYDRGCGVKKDEKTAGEWYRKAILGYEKSNNNSPKIQLRIAEAYDLGRGVERNSEKAVQIYKKLASQGDPDACTHLDVYYQYDGNDEEEAEKWNEKAKSIRLKKANMGDADNQCKYSELIEEENPSKAYDYLKKSADQGNQDAIFNLAYAFATGRGFADKNRDKAIEWYKKGAEAGAINFYTNIGDLFTEESGFPVDYSQAVEWYKKGIAYGSLSSNIGLGNCYFNGHGVQKDCAKAFEYYKRGESDEKLGMCYYYGYGVEKNYHAAFEHLSEAGEWSDYSELLGNCYYYGYGTEQNWDKAYEVYENGKYSFDTPDEYIEKAKSGNAIIQYIVGDAYSSGSYGAAEVGQDDEEALKWYRKSANAGFTKAMIELAGYYEDDNEYEMFKWYMRAAEKGNAEAQYHVGKCYENGIGVESDEYEAFEWYQKAADQDYADAIYNLAECYNYGFGIEQDDDMAFELYSRAAEHEYQWRAEFELGICYELGTGVERDMEEAFRHYMKAADNEYFGEAHYKLGECYEYGFGVEEDEEEAEIWYQKAADNENGPALYHIAKYAGDEYEAFELYLKSAEQGYTHAIHEVGECYEYGIGVEEDIYEAVEWYEKGAELDNGKSLCSLGQLYLDGNGVEKDEYMAFSCFERAYDSNVYSDVCFWLGLCYSNGYGTEVNYGKAAELFFEGYDSYGEEICEYMLAECYRLGRGVNKNRNKALELYKELSESSNTQISESSEKMYNEILQNIDKSDSLKKAAVETAKKVGSSALRLSGNPIAAAIASILDEI